MSVVNKMLKDLEQRGNQSVYEADYVPIEPQSTKSNKLAVGAIIILAILGIATWFLLPEKNIVNVAKTQAQPLNNLTIMPVNEIADESTERATFAAIELPPVPNKKVVLSELDEATLSSLESAKQAEQQPLKTSVVQKPILLAAQQEQTSNATEQAATVAVPEAKQASFNVSSSTTSTSSNRMLEQQIQLSLANGDTDEALKNLYNLISLEPRNASAIKRLASLEFAQGNPVKAGLILKQGVKLLPKDSSIRLMQARLLFRANRNEEALEILLAHPQNVSTDDDLLSFRAALAEKQKDYVTSLADYASLLQRQPSNARWMLGLAISQDKQQMHKEALISYKKVKSSNQLSAQVVSFVDGRLAALEGS